MELIKFSSQFLWVWPILIVLFVVMAIEIQIRAMKSTDNDEFFGYARIMGFISFGIGINVLFLVLGTAYELINYWKGT